MDKTVITIIGLGQIGTSMGLALKSMSERFERIGHTRQYGQGNQAKSLGAVDKVAINLPSAVSEADIVILALPFDQIKETLKIIAEDIKEGALVLDTTPVPSRSIAWAEEMLPEGRNFIAFTPVLNPADLLKPEGGIQNAHADLFQKGLFAITATMGTSSDALNFAGDFAGLLGGTALYADPAEIDSYMAAVHLLPQLMAASLMNTREGKPGWGEIRKIAGRPYAQVTNVLLHTDRAAALAASSIANKEHVMRVMDELIADLSDMRAEIAEDDATAFSARIEKAREGRANWFQERNNAEWLRPVDDTEGVAQAGSIMGQMFGLGRPRPKRGKNGASKKTGA